MSLTIKDRYKLLYDEHKFASVYYSPKTGQRNKVDDSLPY